MPDNEGNREAILALYRRGVSLRGAALRGVDLSKLDLSRVDLEEADLSDACLIGINLLGARLSNARLDGADLSDAVLAHAVAVGTSFAGARLERATLSNANLCGANFDEANLDSANLNGALLHEAQLCDSNLCSAYLVDADLSHAKLEGAALVNATLCRANLENAEAGDTDCDSANFSDANLKGTDFSYASLEGAQFARAQLSDASFFGADLGGADLRDTRFAGTDWRAAKIDRSTQLPQGVDPTGIIWRNVEPNLDITEVLPGKAYPLGATWTDKGVNFSVYSKDASRVELCLFDSPEADTASLRVMMPERNHGIWHVMLPEVSPGQLYGYRVYGVRRPESGMRFNPSKLLVDPYAKALAGKLVWDDSVFGYQIGHEQGDLSLDTRNSAGHMPKCVVIDPDFDWSDDRPPDIPLYRSLIYEVHVKGFTRLHPDIAPETRGTYAALAEPNIIDYLKQLGVTAVELLPIHACVDDRFLTERNFCNYWGYNTLCFLAPEPRYACARAPLDVIREFKSMVKALHAAGIEVILDVVYNHTAEGNHLGPTLSLKGLANADYYRLVPNSPRHYMDFTGCGNTLNMESPRALQLVMDSLRYWVTQMHVDGFRFDLAAALARGRDNAGRAGILLETIAQDPILSQVKLIAEPWDIGPGGYLVGAFPVQWSEWNGRYRDTVRSFWKGDEQQVAELAYRLSGSSDLYQYNGRRPGASVNFITAHDGFTLRDLVSYNHKHNEANGDDNRDGDDHNLSWNCGQEGPSTDLEVNRLRLQQMRNFMAMLLLSQGVPMIQMGDECGRTQMGNNNAYCQDNELSWLHWDLDEVGFHMLAFTRQLIAIRSSHPVLRRRRFFQGRRVQGADIEDLVWLRPDGTRMSDSDWQSSHVRCLGMMLNGQQMTEWSETGELLRDDVLLLLINAYWEAVEFELQPLGLASWQVLIDTSKDRQPDPPSVLSIREYAVASRSLVLLTHSSKVNQAAAPP